MLEIKLQKKCFYATYVDFIALYRHLLGLQYGDIKNASKKYWNLILNSEKRHVEIGRWLVLTTERLLILSQDTESNVFGIHSVRQTVKSIVNVIKADQFCFIIIISQLDLML